MSAAHSHAGSQYSIMGSVARWLSGLLVAFVLLVAGYTWVVLNWSYSVGERAGYVQKLSKKGWICKTWEGELALVTMPGTVAEKFFFSVHDDATAERIDRKSTRLNSSHQIISYAVFCLKKKITVCMIREEDTHGDG